MKTYVDLSGTTYTVNVSSDLLSGSLGRVAWSEPSPVTRFFAPWMELSVEVDDDGTVLAIEEVTGRYGVGYTRAEALKSLMGALLRYRQFLEEQGQERLSPELGQHLHLLQSWSLASPIERGGRSEIQLSLSSESAPGVVAAAPKLPASVQQEVPGGWHRVMAA